MLLSLYYVDQNEVLAGSLAEGFPADAILIPPCPPIPPTTITKVIFGKNTEWVTQKPFTSKRKKVDIGMAKHFSKKYVIKR